MATTVKLTIALLLLSFCCFAQQSSRRKLIAPRPPSEAIPMTGLALWLDIGSGVTNTAGTSPPANGERIKGWKSKAPLTRFIATGNPYYPYYYTTGGTAYDGGRVNFPPLSDYTIGEAPSQTTFDQPLTWFFVIRFTPAAAQAGNYYITDGFHSTLRTWCYFNTNGQGAALTMNAGSSITGAADIQLDAWFLLTLKFAGTNSVIRTNGVQYLAGDAGTVQTSGFKIGAARTLGGQLQGDIAEVLFYTNTVVDMAAIEALLKTKHGL